VGASLLWLGGCASVALPGHPAPGGGPLAATTPAAAALSPTTIHQAVLAALLRGDAANARSQAQTLVLADPRSAQAHLMLGAAHHLAGDTGSLDQALTGYGAARQLGGDGAWAPLLAGLAALQRQQSADALEHFAAAALANPDQALAFEGLAAAYAEGRLPLADAAAQRARSLQQGSAPGWRLAALSAAAAGQADRVADLLRQGPVGTTPAQQQWLVQRCAILLRTASLDGPGLLGGVGADSGADSGGAADAKAEPKVFEAAPNQVTVDVTLILADDKRSKSYGVNLLDGLTSVFSAGRNGSFSSANGAGFTGANTITRAISLPALTYNLNIFNRGSRYYEMLARPSLTAFQGQESNFFVGEQLAVQVSGNNSAALEKLDVGVALKINPSEIRADGATFRVEANRSFFSDQGIGSFAQGVATFKQSVAATADVRFGETLILSGLTESVTDGNQSAVPGLGDVPGPDLLFSRQTQLKRERSVLILVTPSRPAGLLRGRAPSAALDKLVQLWDTVLEPRTGLDALAQRIARAPKFSRAAQGDVVARQIDDPLLMNSLVAALQPR
jgi:tetratricopeptide (TPR) repeat protein